MKNRLPYYVVKIKAISLVLILLFSIQLKSQITSLSVTENSTADEAVQMVHDMLVSGGIQVFNVQFTGYPQSGGVFFGDAGIGFSSGIILTSGRAGLAKGPNTSPGAGNNNGAGGDVDLSVLADDVTYDACVLEFDFIPSAENISLTFVFGSEEYPEGVNANWNDAFGIFLSGPGIEGPFSQGAVNLAVLPDTDIPISVNTVNSDSNAVFFVSNWNPVENNNIQYDGYTVVLTAQAPVEPLLTYHLKIAIADGGDRVYDSGIFIEEGGFTDEGLTKLNPIMAELPFYVIQDQTVNGIEIRLTDLVVDPLEFHLYDASGREISSHRIGSSQQNTFRFTGLKRGVYSIALDCRHGSYATKVLVN
ncbi:MAG: choice-of-anchor L domain-containing protein [Bacteroidales bacterium]|nr:choice-of-anchor L domain-containing protein [Bacteroidales bacterium]